MLDWDMQQYVVLEPHCDFISKTELRQSGASRLKAIRVPALPPAKDFDSPEERSLCPVRALQIYWDRTLGCRVGRNLLFIAYKPGHQGDIHKNTVSSWIRKLVLFAYSSSEAKGDGIVPLSSARTHEVRALASSLAFKGSIELESILRACTWKNGNTFTRHYLRDVSSISDEGLLFRSCGYCPTGSRVH